MAKLLFQLRKFDNQPWVKVRPLAQEITRKGSRETLRLTFAAESRAPAAKLLRKIADSYWVGPISLAVLANGSPGILFEAWVMSHELTAPAPNVLLRRYELTLRNPTRAR